MDLSKVVGGRPMIDLARDYKWHIAVAIGSTAILVTLGMLIVWYYHEKHKNDRWYDENPKEKLFVIEVIDNGRAVTPDQIKEQYGIDEQRASFLVGKHQRR